MRRSLGLLLALAALLAACGAPGAVTPTEGPAATQAAEAPTADLVASAVAATLTAVAPTEQPAVTQVADAPTEPPAPTEATVPTEPPAPTETPADQTDYSTVPIFNDKNGLEGSLGVSGQVAFQEFTPVFGDEIVIRLFVRDPAQGAQDGVGITSVTFEIQGPDGTTVYRRTEVNSGYCAFQGGEPTCNRWRFSEHDNRWPEFDGQSFEVQSGSHFVTMLIKRTNGESQTWNFSFEVQR